MLYVSLRKTGNNLGYIHFFNRKDSMDLFANPAKKAFRITLSFHGLNRLRIFSGRHVC